MDRIDKNLYSPENLKDIDIEDAYKTVFKDDRAVNAVIQDLLRFSQYNSKMINTDAMAQYYIMGQQSVLQRIKDMLNKEHIDDAQIRKSVDEEEDIII